MTNNIKELFSLGQSIWYDNIQRAMIESGRLQDLIDQGVVGVTSNPSIFEKAIVGSRDYDEDLKSMAEESLDINTIYELLVLKDIAATADLLLPVYRESDGRDGYVSLEVRPTLAKDTAGTIEEARRLFTTLDRPNVMIKVPATPEGVPAIETLTADGVNINVTLIFSIPQYEAIAEAYIAGLEKRAAAGQDVKSVASVASFFVSRVDTMVDKQLDALGETELQGKIGIANAKVAFTWFKEIFDGDRWGALTAKGARVQRPLWASTSTKNPAYPDTLYIDGLIGPDTVNTVPPAALEAFLDHGEVSGTLESDVDEARAQLGALAELGVDLNAVTEQLQEDGVQAFTDSFQGLLDGISEKRDALLTGWRRFSDNLQGYGELVDAALDEINQDQVISHIWNLDHTVWKPDPQEITNRLGWLRIAETMLEERLRIQDLVDAVLQDDRGYQHVMLLGMGGSSLAPEVFRETFGVRDGFLELEVLDSTDPGAILAYVDDLDLSSTLFVVSTKSGGTVETLSFFKYFYNRLIELVGTEKAGDHFVAITDQGSQLDEIADRYHFRAKFLNDPNIGGRYSALSYFGLVPAALVGVDLEVLLERAVQMACENGGCSETEQVDNYAARLGVIMAELAEAGRDRLTLIISPALGSFGDWVEQLIAESTGKEGKGILPVVGEPVGAPEVYGDDRQFVYLQLNSDDTYDSAVDRLEAAGFPLVCIRLKDTYDLGGQFFLWELATAVAGARLGINPFNQPNVEAAKDFARQMVATYQAEGQLPEPTPALQSDGILVYGDLPASEAELITGGDALRAFLAQAQQGDYIALQAYVKPDAETDWALLELRTRLRAYTRLACTTGYGPRFLHSTGQLHKGDRGNGLFIQLTADSPEDVGIPDQAGSPESSISFGVLKAAQAMGDRQALLDANRRVIRFHLGKDVSGGLEKLTAALA
jgi:transaldolase/glucose-6-phosphate isomerase